MLLSVHLLLEGLFDSCPVPVYHVSSVQATVTCDNIFSKHVINRDCYDLDFILCENLLCRLLYRLLLYFTQIYYAAVFFIV